jgi:hypothetical protein
MSDKNKTPQSKFLSTTQEIIRFSIKAISLLAKISLWTFNISVSSFVHKKRKISTFKWFLREFISYNPRSFYSELWFQYYCRKYDPSKNINLSQQIHNITTHKSNFVSNFKYDSWGKNTRIHFETTIFMNELENFHLQELFFSVSTTTRMHRIQKQIIYHLLIHLYNLINWKRL